MSQTRAVIRAVGAVAGIAAVGGASTGLLEFGDGYTTWTGRLAYPNNFDFVGVTTSWRFRGWPGRYWSGVSHCSVADGTATSSPPRATSVFSWGYNVVGQLGLGHERSRDLPEHVGGFEDGQVGGDALVKVDAGGNASAALTRGGVLWVWGSSAYGQLGLDGAGVVSRPTRSYSAGAAGQGGRLVDIAVGTFAMVGLSDAGEIIAWGRSVKPDGKPRVMNLGNTAAADGGLKAERVSCGRTHFAAVAEDGSVWTWGSGFDGALGHGDKVDQPHPKKVESLRDIKAADVACGRDFTLILARDGSVWSCGADDFGQLGQGRSHGERYVRAPRTVVPAYGGACSIAAGDYHAAVLTERGEVWTWGMGRDGQLGYGEKSDQAIPTQVPLPVQEGERIIQAACGGGHSGAVSNHGTLFLWGRGRDGQLGRGNSIESIAAYRTKPRPVDALPSGAVLQVSLGADHTLALSELTA
uniref:RCC1-like domain-containing protein n=1 Tax=Compsopogon caeruleus TaxID=31354 RepID=A0A7S1T831_9RHOD|mmetsp:Transcript_12269/g.25025  ORF Transcript_12269/g.25025 Transcript_12269/m.25025 type:complete len:468 (+) Transcript_12269:300-1703(+)